MKFKLLSVALLAVTSFVFSHQKGAFWTTSTRTNVTELDSRMQLPTNHVYDLNVPAFMMSLDHSPKRSATANSNVVTSLPNADGQMGRFSVYENSTMDLVL